MAEDKAPGRGVFHLCGAKNVGNTKTPNATLEETSWNLIRRPDMAIKGTSFPIALCVLWHSEKAVSLCLSAVLVADDGP